MAPRRQQLPPFSLLVQSTGTDPKSFYSNACCFRYDLKQAGHVSKDVIKCRSDNSKFAIPFANAQALANVKAAPCINQALRKHGLRYFTPTNNSFERNKRTVHVKNLDTEFFCAFLNGEKNLEECKLALQAKIQDKLASPAKIENIHILGNHAFHELDGIPRSIQITFNSVEAAHAWCDADTEIDECWILAASKKMHHNISKDICTICRKRNCNKNNSACDKIQRCSRCTSSGHAYPTCDQAPFCNFCKNSDHVTNSDKCPHNREYIKRRLDNIAASRQRNEIANGNENAIGRELLRQGREINQMRNVWQNPPNINNRNNRNARSHSRNSRYGRSQSRPRVNPQSRDPQPQARAGQSHSRSQSRPRANPQNRDPRRQARTGQSQTSAPANPPPRLQHPILLISRPLHQQTLPPRLQHPKLLFSNPIDKILNPG